jgi:hypothetical protein
MYKLSVCLPCNGRPQRTLRILEQIRNQDINGWELFVIGDRCSYFQELIDSGYFEEFKKDLELKGNKIIFENLPQHYGGYGYFIRNKVKIEATGKYIIYVDNDDCITENHFSNYLEGIEGTDLDLVYFDSFVDPLDSVRYSSLSSGNIGHSEIIVRLDFIRGLPDHSPEYEHDWAFVHNIIKYNGKISKSNNNKITYIVKSIFAKREQSID